MQQILQFCLVFLRAKVSPCENIFLIYESIAPRVVRCLLTLQLDLEILFHFCFSILDDIIAKAIAKHGSCECSTEFIYMMYFATDASIYASVAILADI